MFYKFYPKKPMRSFRDLEVYAKTLECAVAIASHVRTSIPDFPELQGMINCALSTPLWIAEAHSMRFSDKKESIMLLERAMAGCNKMVVYLEEAVGIYGRLGTERPDADVEPALSIQSSKDKKSKGKNENKEARSTRGINIGTGTLNSDFANELIKKYLDVRGKIFHLEQSWKKWDAEDARR